MNKSINFIIFVLLIVGIVTISGCTESLTYEELIKEYGAPPAGDELSEWNKENAKKDFVVYLQNYTMLKEMDVEEAKRRTSPRAEDAEIGYRVLDYGETTIEEVNVYYSIYEDSIANQIEGEVLFEINNRWYSIYWDDKIGNPNKKAIDDKIALIISKAKYIE